jgi:hypothetical protein
MSDIGKYKQPQSVPVPNCSGYPNSIAKTQTTKMRGTGAATKGTNFNNSGPTQSKDPINILGR